MRPPGSKFRGLLPHAAHEQALSERSSLESSDPVYEVREAPINETARARRWTSGWAEELLNRWSQELGAEDERTKYDYRGADLVVRGVCDRGRIFAAFLSPFGIERGVAALCEPWLTRVELGEGGSVPEAWALDINRQGDCVIVASSEGWRGAVMMPTVRTGLLSAWVDGEGLALTRRQVEVVLEQVARSANPGDKAHREFFWEMSKSAADQLASIRCAKLRRGGFHHRFLKGAAAQTVVDALWTSKVFEEVEVARGSRWRHAISTIVEGGGIEPTKLSLDCRIRGRSRGLAMDLQVDLFRLTFPPRAHPAAIIIPQSWAAASFEAREDHTSGRLSLVPDTPRARFWLSDEQILEGRFKNQLEQLLADVLASHDGPYR